MAAEGEGEGGVIKSVLRKLTAKNRTTNGAGEAEKGNNVEVGCNLTGVHKHSRWILLKESTSSLRCGRRV